MALVMLPSDLPWWDAVKKHLKNLAETKNTIELADGMQRIHELCNVSLDPDEDTTDPEQFIGLMNFLDNDFTSEERANFFNKTLPNIVKQALKVKELRPKGGLHFSLQQQADCTELEYSFVSSLIANAFFSTFPKRTERSHPTLQNFNFSNFFKHLNSNLQKAKLRSIFHYFDWLDNSENTAGKLLISRQVMSSKEWLTIEDWLECNLPLCSLLIRHEGRLERSEPDHLQVCFASPKIGGNVLIDGGSQECVNLVTLPELLITLLNTEALEDNEVLLVDRVRPISRINDPKNRATLEKLENGQKVTVCCIDADNYTKLPIGQYEEDNILRELNKCLLAFQQKHHQEPNSTIQTAAAPSRLRRLSPIGESTHSDTSNIPLITQHSCSTNRSSSPGSDNNNINTDRLMVKLEAERSIYKRNSSDNEVLNNRRGRFIVLGSSGECLPVKRHPLEQTKSVYSSCDSSEEEFHSARTSLDEGSEDENFQKRYSIDLETAERRQNFAQRLRDFLRRDTSESMSTNESSYAVGISVAGSHVRDGDIKVRRGGSTGFALHEDSLDESFLKDSLQQERQWIDKFKTKQSGLSRKDSNKSSEYSFSTDYSSELEEVYEQFSRWLDHPLIETDKGTKRELDTRELAVVQFAGSLLKRTLSESFAGIQVPLTESCDSTTDCNINTFSSSNKKNKLVLNAKSLSLELARHKHKLAAQLLSQISQKPKSKLKAISTGNWGCGSSRKGDVQLKVVIQWLAASVAGVPALVHYTCGHQQLTKLDTVYRLLVDRKWTVKDLAQAALRYSNHVLHGRELSGTLFEELIGVERTIQ